MSLLKKYHLDEKDLHLWQEDPRSPPEYEDWDGTVRKVTTIFDSRQIHGQGKQYKFLMHGIHHTSMSGLMVRTPSVRIVSHKAYLEALLIAAFEALQS